MIPVLIKEDRSVYANGTYQKLTPKEYGILAFLMSHPDKTFSPEEIYRVAWKLEPYACKPVISVHIRHIREKIEKNPGRPEYLLTRWESGYRFSSENAEKL